MRVIAPQYPHDTLYMDYVIQEKHSFSSYKSELRLSYDQWVNNVRLNYTEISFIAYRNQLLFLMDDDFFKPLAKDVYDDFFHMIIDSKMPVYFSANYRNSEIVGTTNNHFIGGILRGREAGLHMYAQHFAQIYRPYMKELKLMYIHRFTRERLEDEIVIAKRAKQKMLLIDEDRLTDEGDWSEFYILDVDQMKKSKSSL